MSIISCNDLIFQQSGNVNVETTKNTEGQDGEKMDTSNNAGGVGGNSDELLDKNLYSRQMLV